MKRMIYTLFCLLLGGMVYTTAQAQDTPYPLDTINGQVVYRYTVEKSIGLFRISVNFKCRQEQILRLNPGLKENGLHYGETIYVPVPEQQLRQWEEERRAAERQAHEADSLQMAADTLAAPIDMVEDTGLKLALLLPLYVNTPERTPAMERFWDFYEGALLAIYDVQSCGQKLDVSVYDTEKSDARVRRLIESGELNGNQAVIGPAYSSMIAPVGKWSQQHRIPVFIPFTGEVENIDTLSYLYQFNTPNEVQAEVMAQHLQQENVQLIFVDANEADMPGSVIALRRQAKRIGIPMQTTTIQQILEDSLSNVLNDEMENILVLNTERYSNIQILLPALERAAEQHPLTLLSQYSWQKENIRLRQIYTSVFDTEVPASTEHYDRLYEKYFHHDHASSGPRFDLLGYDLTRMAIAQLLGQEYRGLQSDIRFERTGERSGYVNRNVHVIRK